MAMPQAKYTRLLEGQSALAQKVFAAVPIQEPWTTTNIYSALRRSGTAADTRSMRRCLTELKDGGLIREPETGLFQRISPKNNDVAREKDTDMPKPALKAVTGTKATEAGALDALASLASEVTLIAAEFGQRMKALANRIEEVALTVESEREGNAEQIVKIKQLQQTLKSLLGDIQ
ncbi:hypothetical protein [Pseudomonas putida]|uniref:hypothetical protein n=1 Tax=Pseudomonas putida TaxID=303 RepID=UPI0039DFC8E1